MNCLDCETNVGDYVDGTLPPAASTRLEAHLHGCAACHAIAADLRVIRAATLALEPQVPPPQVWQRIAAAVEADASRGIVARLFGARGFGWQPLVSAAVVVLLMGGGIWISWHSVAAGTQRGRTVATTSTPVVSSMEPVDTGMQATERHYTNAIATLEQITQTGATTLDTPTAAVMRENLAVIDRAIGESRQALQQEPSNALAQDSLFDALRSKITLLQDTVALINEMRKGNQEGAARIVSGMNP